MAAPTPLHVLVLAHDLSDTAIQRRVTMLRTGGAAVTLAGFSRDAKHEEDTTCFGVTRNGGFKQRIVMVMKTIAALRTYAPLFAAADIVLARNLEMLAIAASAKKHYPKLKIVYEVLDIHRLLLGAGAFSNGLRWLERQLLASARAILTSSPAFITQYFHGINPTALLIRLVENKLLTDDAPPARAELPQPWIIGWFGMLRCRKSLAILQEAVRQSAGRLQVVMRGKPALDQIPDFHAIVAATPGLSFAGAYRNPDDLSAIYGAVHFSWAIDLYEEGLNSAWLLPNRIYEGGYYGAVPIALGSVETGRKLQAFGIGIQLDEPLAESLTATMMRMTPSTYRQLATKVAAVPAATWAYTTADCRELVQFLSNGLDR